MFINLIHQSILDISSAYFSTSSFSFISNQMMYTTSSGRMHGSSQPFGKFCLTLSCLLSAFFGHHLKVQHGKSSVSLSLSSSVINLYSLMPARAKWAFSSMLSFHIHHLYLTVVSVLDRYAYRDDGSDEFDRDETTLTLIKPSPISSKDVRSVPDARSVQSSNGNSNDVLEEDKRE